MRPRPGAVKRHHLAHRNRRVQADHRQGVRSDQDLYSCRTITPPTRTSSPPSRQRSFATSRAEQGITHYYEVGCMGVEHALLPEKGVVVPGDLMIGADCHTCTYGALGAFSTGVGSTDAGVGYATGTCLVQGPRDRSSSTIDGERCSPAWWARTSSCTSSGSSESTAHCTKAMEFTGSAIDTLSMEEPPDHLQHGHRGRRQSAACSRSTTSRVPTSDASQGASTYVEYHSDAGCSCTRRCIEIDAADIAPDRLASASAVQHQAGGRMRATYDIDQAVIGSAAPTGASRTCARQRPCCKRAQGAPRRALHRHPRNAGRVPSVHPRGPHWISSSTRNCAVRDARPAARAWAATWASSRRGSAPSPRANRNFIGRMGDPTSEVHPVEPPAVAAASGRARPRRGRLRTWTKEGLS